MCNCVNVSSEEKGTTATVRRTRNMLEDGVALIICVCYLCVSEPLNFVFIM